MSQSTNRNYMEAHHLIPMEFQGQFQYSLDVPDNIVSLCSNCHNKIHYAIKEDKKQLVEQLFQKRMSGLESRKIPVELDKLMKYYGI
ncbi:HNH endonuclease [Pseudoalteromonas sp. Hal099]